MSVRRGQKRFISRNDILREYPSLTPSMLDRDIADIKKDISDTNGTSEYTGDVLDVPNVPSVQKEPNLNVYSPDKKQDLLIQNIEQVRSVVSRLEKSIANIDYIQRDTKIITRRLDNTNARNNKIEGLLTGLTSTVSRMERQKGHGGHLIGFGVLAFIIVVFLAAGIFGAVKFKGFYQEAQVESKNLLEVRDTQIDSLRDRLNSTVLNDTRRMGEKDLEIERLKGTNEHMASTIVDLQETKTRRRGGF